MSIGLTRCKTTWFDEAAYASSAVNWCLHGKTGPACYPGVGVSDVSVYPVHPVVLGTFYKTFGIGLVQTRAFGLLCYLGTLAAVYMLLRQLGCEPLVCQLATLVAATDRSLVWLVRSGRPDTLTILLVTVACLAMTYACHHNREVGALLAAVAAGIAAALAPLAHPYSVPAIGIASLFFLVVLLRRPRNWAAASVFVIGGLAVLLVYGLYVQRHWSEMSELYALSSQFLNELTTKQSSIWHTVLLEIKQRWIPGIFVNPFPLLLIVFGAGFLRKRNRALLLGASCWVFAYFAVLWLRVPKDTHYQVAYVTIPIAVMLAFVIQGAVCSIRNSDRAKQGIASKCVFGLWWAAVVVGMGLMMLYPAAALLQWRERSYTNVVEEVAQYVPENAVVATDPGAYFALLENGCNPYFVGLRYRGLDRNKVALAEYRRGLLVKGVSYSVVYHDSWLPAKLEKDGWHLKFCGTVGLPKKDLWFAKDPPYHFDVYEVAADEMVENIFHPTKQ